MDLVQIKIQKDERAIKYIKIIREFDSSLSMGDIKRKIEEDDYVLEFDLEYFDVLEDLNEIDRKKIFRATIDDLCQAGAQIAVYQNGELSSIELLDNRLAALEEIRRETDIDMDREAE